jgi:predicted ATPase/DNA-binding SARP family transcriptional activator
MRGDDVLSIGPPLQRALLAALLVDGSHTVQVPVLLDRLWGDDPPETAVKSIQKYVSNLRRVLGADRIVSNGGYRLVSDIDEIDELRFERALTMSGSEGKDPEQRLALLEDALALWRGEPYADLPQPLFLEPVRVRLGEMRLAIIEDRLSLMLDLGRYDRVSTETGELVDLHPLRERLWRLRMTALAGMGRQAEALGEYRRLRELLGEQLGLEPSPETAALEERILLQDPALAPPRNMEGNLPPRSSSIVGRESDLERLEVLLERSRLLTILGTAGVGKTTLALELARRLEANYPQGAWIVGLGPIGDPQRVHGVTAEVLGVPEAAMGAGSSVLGEHLSGRRALILFDNCEHVVDAAAELISRLMISTPEVDVIVTSRQPLGIGGETVFNVDALPFPSSATPAPLASDYPAVRLLVTRAEEAGARLPPLEQSVRDLADIARCLDGIPLAIELAAARLRLNSPAELSKRLRDRISPLSSGRRDAPERQQTIEAAIDWSFRLLDPPERQLLARLSVFRGSFSLDAAVLVCGSDDQDVESLLSTLIDRSLVTVQPQAEGSNRYLLLHVIRLFAQARLDVDDSARTARHHAEYFGRLAVGEDSPEARLESRHLSDLAVDYENLRAAMAHLFDTDTVTGLRLAASLGTFWLETGRMSEAKTWLERFLAVSSEAPAEFRSSAYLALSQAYQPMSTQLALRASESALVDARTTGDRRLVAHALHSVGRAYARRLEQESAVPLIEQALEIFEDLDDKWGMAQCHDALGITFAGSTRGLNHHVRAIELYRDIGASHDLASTLYSMAYRSLIPAGSFDDARVALDESLNISRGLQTHLGILHAQTGLGQLARLEGSLDEARMLLGECLEGMRDLGDHRCTVRVLAALAQVMHAQTDNDRAWTYLDQAAGLVTEDDPGTLSDLVDILAITALASGDAATAALWMGAAESTRLRRGLRRAPPDETSVVEARQQIEAAIGSDRAQLLIEEGSGVALVDIAVQVRHRKGSAANSSA